MFLRAVVLGPQAVLPGPGFLGIGCSRLLGSTTSGAADRAGDGRGRSATYVTRTARRAHTGISRAHPHQPMVGSGDTVGAGAGAGAGAAQPTVEPALVRTLASEAPP
jgi:hypothetical protein